MERPRGHLSLWAIGALAVVVAIAVASSALLIAHGESSHAAPAGQARRLSASLQGASPAQSTPSAGSAGQQGQGRAYLGVQVSETGGKVSVTQAVSGGPADKAGIKAGDVIAAIDGTSIGSFADLKQALAAKKPGDTVTVSVDRGGSKQDVKVT